MKRFYLLLIIAILVSVAPLANSEARESKLTQLFPSASIVWQKTLQGILTNFVIAKDSGYVAISTMEGPSGNRKGYVYFFAPNGRLLWKLSNESNTGLKTVWDINLSLSDNGKTLLVDWWGDYESSEKQVYDKSGRFLFKNYDNAFQSVGYSISPGGGYFTPGLFRRDGIKVDLSPLDPQKWRFGSFRFISKGEIALIASPRLSKQQHRQLCIVSLPDGRLKWKFDLRESGYAMVKKVGNRLYVQTYIRREGENTGYVLHCFTDDGTEIWRIDGSYMAEFGKEYVDSFQSGEYVAFSDPYSRWLYILDARNGAVVTSNRLGRQYSLSLIHSFFCAGNKIMLSGELCTLRPDHSLPTPWNRTYIWQFGNELKIVDERLVNGLVIGRSGSKFIGIYESDSEERDSKLRKICHDFQVGILKEGGE
jgi:hypothetical protein